MEMPGFNSIILYIAIIWLMVILVLGLKALIYILRFKGAQKAARLVHDAIHAAGTCRDIRATPVGLPHIPPDITSIITTQNGRLKEGVGVLLVNNDATFWLKKETVYVVNDEAKKLLPNAPEAPAQITDTAVRSVAT